VPSEVVLDQLPVHQPSQTDQWVLHVELLVQARAEHLSGLCGTGMGLHGLQDLQESARPVFVSLQISHHTPTEIALQINGLRVVQGGLGILDVRAEVLPSDKAAIVQALRASGEVVAFVGDGLNDGPALAAASCGFAMAGGADVATETAGVTLMRGDPRLVADALDVSRRTYAKIKQGLFWAFAYNVLGIPLAALGMLNPVIAGAAMALSSLSVIANALLLRRWRGVMENELPQHTKPATVNSQGAAA